MPNVLKLVGLGGVGALLLISGVLAITEGAFVTGSIVAMVGAWLLLSIKQVGPAEMAVFVLLGEPTAFCDSGLRFVPFLFARLTRFPKKMYNFNYRAREVVTRAEVFETVSYGAQVLKVDAAAYLNFPRERRVHPEKQEVYMQRLGLTTEEQFEQAWRQMEEEEREELLEETHPLIKILRAGVPVLDKELEAWTEEAVVGALRVAFGRMTWRQAVQDPEAVTKEAEEVFRAPDGALIRAGFSKKGIRLVVAEIHLPQELKEALPDVDRQRLEAEAAPFEALQRAEETGGAVMENFARLSGMSRQAVETALRENPEAFIGDHGQAWEQALDLTRREQAIKGRSFVDVRVQGAEGIERAFLNLLGVLQRMPTGGGGAPATAEPAPAREKLPSQVRRDQQLRDTTDKIRERGGEK